MIELVISIIFLVSFAGVIFILARKIPVLNTLPQNGSTGIKKHHIILDIEEKAKNFFLSLEKQIFLHKLLFWIKRMTIKIEARIDHSLHNIRKKAQKAGGEPKNRK